MIVIIIFVAIILGLNCIPLFIKGEFQKIDKIVTQILIFSLIVFIIFVILFFNGYQLIGIYSNLIISLFFILTNILFFVLVKNTQKKMIIVCCTTPLILLSLFIILFGNVIVKYRINDDYKIVVTRGGLLACGEIIKITKSEFDIFDKEVYYESNLCLRGIYRIDILKFNNTTAKFLIYHNGELDSENPYKYEIENKKLW